jgi:AraC-like DNA-binding protein
VRGKRGKTHDQDTRGVSRKPGIVAVNDALSAALEHLRLEGALFFRSELSDPFEFESSPLALADALVPGADRLTLFHIVASGSCWVAVEDGVRYRADVGDVIVLPYGDHYVMGGAGSGVRVSILSLLDPLPWEAMPVLRHGGGGRRTEIVCGYLHSTDPLFDPAMRALPPVFVVRLTDGRAAGWVKASIDYAMTDAVPPSNRSSNVIATRLPELVLIEVLRTHLASAPAIEHGWIAALRDPLLAPALALLHQQPQRRWTVAELATAVATSRSALDDRFRQVLRQSPIRYLTAWRMHLAIELLATTELTISTIGRRIGYDSEEAFSRAFKREQGASPSHWRATATREPRDLSSA